MTGAVLGKPVLSTPSYPRCTTYFQQRQAFGGFSRSPERIVLSRSGDYPNFSYSTPAKDDDSVDFVVASTQLNAVKHLISLNSLLALTDSGAFKIDAPTQGNAITPSAINVTPQVYNGASDVAPLVINYDILYVQGRGSIVRDLSYNFYVNLYTGTDITALASHLFYGRQILEWAYAEEPFKIVWAVRDDGVLLSLTYLKEQDVTGWAHHDTHGGHFKSVCSIIEGEENVVYAIVQRFIRGRFVQYYERFASRQLAADPAYDIPGNPELAWFVDCGLRYPLREPAARLLQTETMPGGQIVEVVLIAPGAGYLSPTVVISDLTGTGAVITPTVFGGRITALTVNARGSGYTNPVISIFDEAGSGAIARPTFADVVTMNADAAVFTSNDIGACVRVNHGRGTVLDAPSASQIVVALNRALKSIFPAEVGEWSCTQPVTVVHGLDHLEGETIACLADGSVTEPLLVTNGTITLPNPASAIVAGQPITADLLSLYIDLGDAPTNQSKRMKVGAVTVRMQDSRGLKVGHDFDDLVEFKERGPKTSMGQAIDLITGDERVVMASDWRTPGQIAVRQTQPLPCNVLGLIPEIVVGDT